MQIFATNYPKTMSEDIDNGNDLSWELVNCGKGIGPGRHTKSSMSTGFGKYHDTVPDSDMPAKSPSGNMQVA